MWKKQNRPDRDSNNRFNFIITIIFLFCLVLCFQLYRIQIQGRDFYTSLASRQHQLYSELKPERGKIFVNDLKGGEDTLFPWATNKDFAEVFVVPKDALNIDRMAEKLYAVFDELEVKAEVDKYFKEMDQQELDREIANELEEDQTWDELRQIKYDLEIDRRREEIIDSYLKKLRKQNDPYEPIRRKVSPEKLLELYALFLSNDDRQVQTSDLEIKFEKIYYQGNYEESITVPGLGFAFSPFRYYPDGALSAHLLGFVNIIDDEEKGNYGLEEFFNPELYGSVGSVKGERGAGSTMIVNNREYIAPERGADLFLTIDRAVQFEACQQLANAVEKYKISSGSIIVVEPQTGAILAMCSYPDFDPNNYQDVDSLEVYNNPAVLYQYEPGSVFKTITMAAALDQGKVNPSTTYYDEGSLMINGWPKPIRNSDFETFGPHGLSTMTEVLENSLNTGAIFAMQQIGASIFADYVQNFGFGEKTGVELGAESSGNIDNLLNNRIKEIDAATASFGQGIAVTPLQMVMSYAAIANGGVLMKPYLVKEIVYDDGSSNVTRPQKIRQVISPQSASLVSAMLVNVIDGGHAKKAAVAGYYIGGKTGTAQVASSRGGYSEDNYVHNFVGIAPIDNPRFVAIVKLDNPQGVRYSADSAAPIFGEIADFLLKYYQIPKER